MVFADWTLTVDDGAGALDGSVAYAGPSSYGGSARYYNRYAILTHDTFSQNQAQIILWVRHAAVYDLNNAYVKLSTYSKLSVKPSAKDEWQKFRVTFWYDITTDTRWGRVEKWVAGAWVQQDGDSNCGSGSPAAGSLSLENWSYETYWSNWSYYWFDELEIYS